MVLTRPDRYHEPVIQNPARPSRPRPPVLLVREMGKAPLFRRLSSDGGVMVATVEQALAAWRAHDQDDPFPLFARVREVGAVHPVILWGSRTRPPVLTWASTRPARIR